MAVDDASSGSADGTCDAERWQSGVVDAQFPVAAAWSLGVALLCLTLIIVLFGSLFAAYGRSGGRK